MIEKIVVAVAGRGLCEEMINQLLDIPAIGRASITVLHVVPPQVTADGMVEALEEGGKILAQAVKTLKAEPTKVNPRLKQGDAKTIVCEVAEEENADLIIMGSRALGRLRSILENSVSQYVFQLTGRPMLLIKDGIFVRKLKRVMVAMNKSESARQALQWALFLTRDIKGAQIILARVNPTDPESRAEDDPVLAEAIQKVKNMGVDYRAVAPQGKAGPEICKIAEEFNVDLLVLGSPDRRPSVAKGLPDLDRLLGQSLSDYVRVYAECPVLLSRQPEN
ncbi:universal stress protein [Oscillatoriales cyanobacterium LEGE 11467]|uniref:Universal stress protein n=1 Tax=Zarconia navalis LEGE 11467 TaxID=1828826 RepID=A0A928W0R8_9CYAN|nr:universal stress protein [Zarconia navalis]MBE9041175.1 universal stress protein [Zarconia navalis LEGE 11467]